MFSKFNEFIYLFFCVSLTLDSNLEPPQNAIQNGAMFPSQGYISHMIEQQYYYNQRTLNYHQYMSPNSRTLQVEQNYQGKKRYAGESISL